MFSGSSTGRGAVLQLLCCPSKQGGLSENMLQNLIHNLTAQTVHRMPLSPHPLLRGSSRCNNAPSSTSNNSSRMFPILHPPKDRRLRLSPPLSPLSEGVSSVSDPRRFGFFSVSLSFPSDSQRGKTEKYLTNFSRLAGERLLR